MRDEKPESEKGVVISMRDAIHIINELRAYDFASSSLALLDSPKETAVS